MQLLSQIIQTLMRKKSLVKTEKCRGIKIQQTKDINFMKTQNGNGPNWVPLPPII